MRDANLKFSASQVVTADGFSTNALNTGKTGYQGFDVEVVIEAVSGTSPTLDITCYTKDADSGWATTDRKAGVAQAQIIATGRYFFRVVSKNTWLKLYYDVGGTTPSFTISSHIVAAMEKDGIA